MEALVRDAALGIVVSAAYVRVAAVLVGALRSLRGRRRAHWNGFGLIGCLAAGETVVLAAVAYPVYREALQQPTTVGRALVAVAGAVLAIGYLALLVWTVASWRGVFSGQGVMDDQRLVTDGAFGLVRHPLYLGAILLWAGVTIANLSMIAAVATIIVIPTYLSHAAREERMMAAAFGDAYTRYCADVPGFIPAMPLSR